MAIKAGDVFCFCLDEEKQKGYGRVIDFVGAKKRIPCIEFYRLEPKAEFYSLDDIRQAPVLRRITGGGNGWEFIGNIPVETDDIPQYYWSWCGDTLIPTPESYTNDNMKLFCLGKRADHLPLGVDYSDKRRVSWNEARLQIEDCTHSHISGILTFIRHMKDENMITKEDAESMKEYVKKHYTAILNTKANPRAIDVDKIFVESDQAADVKEIFGQYMRKTKNVEKATEAVLAELTEMVEDPDDGPVVYLALAILQAKKKQLIQTIKERALEIIEKDIGIERWKETGDDTLKEHLELRKAIKKYIVKL